MPHAFAVPLTPAAHRTSPPRTDGDHELVDPCAGDKEDVAVGCLSERNNGAGFPLNERNGIGKRMRIDVGDVVDGPGHVAGEQIAAGKRGIAVRERDDPRWRDDDWKCVDRWDSAARIGAAAGVALMRDMYLVLPGFAVVRRDQPLIRRIPNHREGIAETAGKLLVTSIGADTKNL